MKRRTLWWLGAGVAGLGAGIAFLPALRIPPARAPLDLARPASEPVPGAVVPGFRTVAWDDLLHPGWTPANMPAAGDVAAWRDDDPRAAELLARLRERWNEAPPNPALEGVPVNLAGYIVPLDQAGGLLRSFLLVPHFGACIHTPPPPANQIVHVVLREPTPKLHSMDAVWVRGVLRAERVDSEAGTSSYRIEAVSVEKYIQSWRWN